MKDKLMLSDRQLKKLIKKINKDITMEEISLKEIRNYYGK